MHFVSHTTSTMHITQCDTSKLTMRLRNKKERTCPICKKQFSTPSSARRHAVKKFGCSSDAKKALKERQLESKRQINQATYLRRASGLTTVPLDFFRRLIDLGMSVSIFQKTEFIQSNAKSEILRHVHFDQSEWDVNLWLAKNFDESEEDVEMNFSESDTEIAYL